MLFNLKSNSYTVANTCTLICIDPRTNIFIVLKFGMHACASQNDDYSLYTNLLTAENKSLFIIQDLQKSYNIACQTKTSNYVGPITNSMKSITKFQRVSPPNSLWERKKHFLVGVDREKGLLKEVKTICENKSWRKTEREKRWLFFE